MRDHSRDKLELFFSKYKTLHYKKGEVILRGGDEPRGVFYLKKGFVRLYSISKSGEELTLIIFESGDSFPISWAINNSPNTYFLESMTASELWRMPKDAFLEFIKSEPDVSLDVTSRILTRFLNVLRRMEDLVFGDAYNKIATILVICSRRFGRSYGKNVVIEVPLTHKDIASLVGVTRETASIEIKSLEKKGLIGYRGRLLVVKNLKGLEKLSPV